MNTFPHNEHRCIVLGYDGSPASQSAFALAVARARERDATLYIVHTYDAPRDHLGTTSAGVLLESAVTQAEALVASLTAGAAELLDGLRWEVEIMGAHPAAALAQIARTRNADELIIGTRGSGRVRALMGSVTHEVIHLASCPVTVVPEGAAVTEQADASEALTAAV